MKPTQTAIAVAVALTVIVFFFIFNGMSIFTSLIPTTGTTTNQTASTAMPTVTDLQITDEIIGTGAAAVAGDKVTVQYVGSLTDGTVFDASASHSADGFTFNLGKGEVIQGWDQGIVGMKEGGKRKLVIPAPLAYGDRAVGNIIPANSTLVFEVELLKVQK